MRIKRLIFISVVFFLVGRRLEDNLLFFCAVHTFVLSVCVLICKLEMLSRPQQEAAATSPVKKAP